MTEGPAKQCDEVLAALMASLDGEHPALPASTIQTHVQTCDTCRASAADLAALHARLSEVTYDGPRVDLWPAVSAQVVGDVNARREWIAIALIAAICVPWRTGQLLFDWPLPIVNAVVPLAALVLIAAWFVGDPLTIKITPELRQERA